jgi:Fe-S-cluster containining protein
MEELLLNYRNLIARVDSLACGIEEQIKESLTCHAGCSGCCSAITIFPVEAAALKAALDSLPVRESAAIRKLVSANAGGERCPLLMDNRCLLYESRPVICRTHGLPITFTENNKQRLDCCPLNQLDNQSLPGSAVIDLDRLNSLLVAVNSLFLKESGCSSESSQRLTIVEAVTGIPACLKS